MEKKKDRGINFKYAFLHGSYWLFLQVVLGFMVMIYKEYGFSNMQIGMIGTCIAGGCAIFQPIYGILCDRVGANGNCRMCCSFMPAFWKSSAGIDRGDCGFG